MALPCFVDPFNGVFSHRQGLYILLLCRSWHCCLETAFNDIIAFLGKLLYVQITSCVLPYVYSVDAQKPSFLTLITTFAGAIGFAPLTVFLPVRFRSIAAKQ